MIDKLFMFAAMFRFANSVSRNSPFVGSRRCRQVNKLGRCIARGLSSVDGVNWLGFVRHCAIDVVAVLCWRARPGSARVTW
jgi:hypothetical protein